MTKDELNALMRYVLKIGHDVCEKIDVLVDDDGEPLETRVKLKALSTIMREGAAETAKAIAYLNTFKEQA